jgi:hypothetical protein
MIAWRTRNIIPATRVHDVVAPRTRGRDVGGRQRQCQPSLADVGTAAYFQYRAVPAVAVTARTASTSTAGLPMGLGLGLQGQIDEGQPGAPSDRGKYRGDYAAIAIAALVIVESAVGISMSISMACSIACSTASSIACRIASTSSIASTCSITSSIAAAVFLAFSPSLHPPLLVARQLPIGRAAASINTTTNSGIHTNTTRSSSSGSSSAGAAGAAAPKFRHAQTPKWLGTHVCFGMFVRVHVIAVFGGASKASRLPLEPHSTSQPRKARLGRIGGRHQH